MRKDRNEKALDKFDLEGPVVQDRRLDPEISPRVSEVIENLTQDELDELLQTLIQDGGLERLSTLVQEASTPGAIDLFLDRVCYFHFLPSVREYE